MAVYTSDEDIGRTRAIERLVVASWFRRRHYVALPYAQHEASNHLANRTWFGLQSYSVQCSRMLRQIVIWQVYKW